MRWLIDFIESFESFIWLEWVDSYVLSSMIELIGIFKLYLLIHGNWIHLFLHFAPVELVDLVWVVYKGWWDDDAQMIVMMASVPLFFFFSCSFRSLTVIRWQASLIFKIYLSLLSGSVWWFLASCFKKCTNSVLKTEGKWIKWNRNSVCLALKLCKFFPDGSFDHLTFGKEFCWKIDYLVRSFYLMTEESIFILLILCNSYNRYSFSNYRLYFKTRHMLGSIHRWQNFVFTSWRYPCLTSIRNASFQ